MCFRPEQTLLESFVAYCARVASQRINHQVRFCRIKRDSTSLQNTCRCLRVGSFDRSRRDTCGRSILPRAKEEKTIDVYEAFPRTASSGSFAHVGKHCRPPSTMSLAVVIGFVMRSKGFPCWTR